MSASQCKYVYLNGEKCVELALSGKGKCLFHDDEAWKIQGDEIRKRIKAKVELGDYNFEGYHFPEIHLFENHSPTSEANFEKAYFHGAVSFHKAQFQNSSHYGNFKNSKFSSHVNFSEASFQNANFTNAEFTDANFIGFSVSGLADFTGVKFSKCANFERARLGTAHFEDAEFEKSIFWNTNFRRIANFTNTKFQNGDFRLAKFRGNAFFHNSRFSFVGNFDRTEFFNEADFRGADFYSAFFYTNFGNQVDFGAAHITIANFRGSNFTDADFHDVIFHEANFHGIKVSGRASFERAQFITGNFNRVTFLGHVNFDYSHALNDNNEKTFWKADFKSTIFEKTVSFNDAYLDPCFESTIMSSSNLKDTIWPNEQGGFFGKHKKKLTVEIKADEMENGIEKMKQYQKAIRTYFFLRNQLQTEGDFIDESDFFYRERYTQKKLLGVRRCLKEKDLTVEQKSEIQRLSGGLQKEYIRELLWLNVIWIICGFGERFLYIITIFIATWIGSAILYLFTAINPPKIYLEYFLRALYTSVGSLSNMGYNDNYILNLNKLGLWIIQIEALFGIFLMSLFLVVFVRKMSRQ